MISSEMQPLTDPRRLARRRTAALAKQIPAALLGDVEGVHQARVASRRLREFLPLVGGDGEQAIRVRRLRRQVRRLTRALGVVRELDVSLLILREMASGRPEHAETVARLTVAVSAQRALAFVSMCTTMDKADGRAVIRRSLEVAAGFADAEHRSRAAGVLASRLDDRMLVVRQTLDAAGTVYAPDRLHRVRIAMKKLRYALELGASLGGFRLAGTLNRLKRLQDLLGTQHDLDVLAVRVRDCGADVTDATLQPGFDAIVRDLDETVRHRHSEFLHARPSLDVVFFWAEHVCRALEARAVITPGAAASVRSSGPAAPADSAT
jgi:CHAD domain-containing protein